MDQIKKIFQNFNKRPVAFIGSGISKRYLDTPTWENLLKLTVKEYNQHDSHYGHLALKCNHDIELVASMIEDEYNDYFYTTVTTNKEHKDYQLYEEYKELLDSAKITPYKIFTSKVFSNAITNDTFINEKDSFIKMLHNCSNVITTNYDTLIEDVSDYKKVVGSKAFISEQCIGFGEVYKIHGCCTEPNSIIITKNDYDSFNKKQSFYHAKLLLSFIEKPIIFLGYSISDKYIQKILNEVSDNLDDNEINDLVNRLVFVEYDKNTIKPQIYIKQISKINMTCIKLKDFSMIYNLIAENVNVGIPIELIRMFQEAVKNFVYEQNNPNALEVKGIDEIEDIKNLKAFHVGVKPVSDRKDIIKPEDLIIDVLKKNLKMDPEEILKIVSRETTIFQKNSYIPLYSYGKRQTKYRISYLNDKIFDTPNDMYVQCSKVEIRILPTEAEVIKAINSTNKSYEKLSYIQSNLTIIKTETLRIILSDLYEKDPDILTSDNRSTFRKLICMLDYLESL